MLSIARLGMNIQRLFYPHVCALCKAALVKSEQGLCAFCISILPRARFISFVENPVHQAFRGRVPVRQAGSFLTFRSGGVVQELLHQIKYRDNTGLAEAIGHYYASELLASGFVMPEILLPVPLHPAKLRQRGYNQSEVFAEGLAGRLGIKQIPNALLRRHFTETQTKKNRWDRWQNVDSVFVLKNPERFSGKTIAVVDDVVTTGATLESCISVLLKANVQSIDVLTIAYAKE